MVFVVNIGWIVLVCFFVELLLCRVYSLDLYGIVCYSCIINGYCFFVIVGLCEIVGNF